MKNDPQVKDIECTFSEFRNQKKYRIKSNLMKDYNPSNAELASLFLDTLEDKSDFSTASEKRHQLVNLLLNVQENDTVLDIGSGYGTFLAKIAKDHPGVHLRGVEMNLNRAEISEKILKTIDSSNVIIQADALNSPIEKADKIYLFPPYGQTGKRLDAQYIDEDAKYLFEKGRDGRSDPVWAFVFVGLKNLKDENSRMVALLPEHALYSSYDCDIREYLVKNHLVEGVISLGNDVTNAKTLRQCLVVFTKNGSPDVSLLDAREQYKDQGSPIEVAKKIYEEYRTDEDTLHISEKDFEGDKEYNLIPRAHIAVIESDDAISLSEKFDIFTGTDKNRISFLPSDERTETRFLSASDIDDCGLVDGDTEHDGVFDYLGLENVKDIQGNENSVKIHKGDILITNKSTRIKIGWIENEPRHDTYAIGSLFILRAKDEDILLSSYLKAFLDSEKGKILLATIEKNSKIISISLESLKNLKVSLPSDYREIGERYLESFEEYRKVKNILSEKKDSLNDILR